MEKGDAVNSETKRCDRMVVFLVVALAMLLGTQSCAKKDEIEIEGVLVVRTWPECG